MKKMVYLLLILIPFYAAIDCSDKAKEAEAFAMRARILGDLIMAQTSAYINQSKAYISAWEYSKVTGEDFKTSVKHVLGAQAEHAQMDFLSMKEKIAGRLEKLGQPPQEYAEAHEKLIVLHEHYLKLHSLALNPKPTQEEYEKSINELATKIERIGREFYSLLGIQAPNHERKNYVFRSQQTKSL
jgi:hypothetical protein